MKKRNDFTPTRVTMPGLKVVIDGRRAVGLFRCDDGGYMWWYSRTDGTKEIHTELRVSPEAFAAMAALIDAARGHGGASQEGAVDNVRQPAALAGATRHTPIKTPKKGKAKT